MNHENSDFCIMAAFWNNKTNGKAEFRKVYLYDIRGFEDPVPDFTK